MIMTSPEPKGVMPKNSSKSKESPFSDKSEKGDSGRLLKQRLELVEDLWKTVLKSECPPEQTQRLLRLKELSDPTSLEGADQNGIVLLIKEMDLAEAISAARAFSLYFQLFHFAL